MTISLPSLVLYCLMSGVLGVISGVVLNLWLDNYEQVSLCEKPVSKRTKCKKKTKKK